MSKKSNRAAAVLFALSASLIVAAFLTFFLSLHYRRASFQMLEGFCEKIIQKHPDSRQNVLEVIKAQDFYDAGKTALSDNPDPSILTAFGYRPSDLRLISPALLWISFSGFLAGGALFLFSFTYQNRKSAARIRALTEYLEKINTGGQGLLAESFEDEFSKLQDEIYKTVTALCQTREEALHARNNFAENLSNIAHQLKTPITSLSLTVQMAKESSDDCLEEQSRRHALAASKNMLAFKKIERQISRLAYLQDALLLLSRIDTGTLALDQKPADVFTILSLASDHLYELFLQKGVRADVPEMGEVYVHVDLDWTMEAVMNLMKNCLEAAEAGTAVHCSYEKNPLYVQIRIWDEGRGFLKEDLPYLFERFYRGKKAKTTGIGIGLSLSKAIIEMQNGVIRACNLPNGGACFEIRFYAS